MSHQDDVQSVETPADQHAQEILGEAVGSQTRRPSVVARIARASLYGVLLLAATALVAVSAVPELAFSVTFIPDAARPEPDPEFLAAIVARQQAYMRNECPLEDCETQTAEASAPSSEDAATNESGHEDASVPTADESDRSASEEKEESLVDAPDSTPTEDTPTGADE